MGWAGKPKAGSPCLRAPTVVLCSQQVTEMYTIHRIDRDGHWQQTGTSPILISTPQWSHRPCNAPVWLYRIGKKAVCKSNLVIYKYVVDVS